MGGSVRMLQGIQSKRLHHNVSIVYAFEDPRRWKLTKLMPDFNVFRTEKLYHGFRLIPVWKGGCRRNYESATQGRQDRVTGSGLENYRSPNVPTTCVDLPALASGYRNPGGWMPSIRHFFR